MLNPRLQPGGGMPQKWCPVGALQLALKTCCRDFAMNCCYVLYTNELKFDFPEIFHKKTRSWRIVARKFVIGDR